MNKTQLLGILCLMPMSVCIIIPVGIAIYKAPLMSIGAILFIGLFLLALYGLSLLDE